MKNVYLLPTDKPSRLYSKNGNHKLANSTMAMDWYISSACYIPHNIYITSDEEIKEGDWCIIVDAESAFYGQLEKHKGKYPRNNQWRKITLTTDPSLVGVQQIDDEFLKWFVKNPKCEFVEVKKDYLAGYYIPQKQETLEEAAKNYSIGWGQCDDKKAFIAGAKWQQERDYELIDRYVDDVMGGCNLKFKEWVNR